jgi:hypothetical protein
MSRCIICDEEVEFDVDVNDFPKCVYTLTSMNFICSKLCSKEYIVRASMELRTMDTSVVINLDEYSCIVCNSKQTKRCAGCKSIHYCCRHCQKLDWHRHKLSCSRYTRKFIKATKRVKKFIKYSVEAEELRTNKY